MFQQQATLVVFQTTIGAFPLQQFADGAGNLAPAQRNEIAAGVLDEPDLAQGKSATAKSEWMEFLSVSHGSTLLWSSLP
jgi:hypothetical protein